MTGEQQTREAARLRALEGLIELWRGMVAHAHATGAIPGDETGHQHRWYAVEMCADELEAVLRGAGSPE